MIERKKRKEKWQADFPIHWYILWRWGKIEDICKWLKAERFMRPALQEMLKKVIQAEENDASLNSHLQEGKKMHWEW